MTVSAYSMLCALFVGFQNVNNSSRAHSSFDVLGRSNTFFNLLDVPKTQLRASFLGAEHQLCMLFEGAVLLYGTVVICSGKQVTKSCVFRTCSCCTFFKNR